MSLKSHSIFRIFTTNPITLAEMQLNEARLHSLESAKKALYHKAESECNLIYARMYQDHAGQIIKQLSEWNKE